MKKYIKASSTVNFIDYDVDDKLVDDTGYISTIIPTNSLSKDIQDYLEWEIPNSCFRMFISGPYGKDVQIDDYDPFIDSLDIDMPLELVDRVWVAFSIEKNKIYPGIIMGGTTSEVEPNIKAKYRWATDVEYVGEISIEITVAGYDGDLIASRVNKEKLAKFIPYMLTDMFMRGRKQAVIHYVDLFD